MKLVNLVLGCVYAANAAAAVWWGAQLRFVTATACVLTAWPLLRRAFARTRGARG